MNKMNELNKIKQINYIIGSGAVNVDDNDLAFNVGDKQVAFIQLRGTMEGYIKAQMKIRTPNGEIVLIEGKIITNNRNVCREFPVVVDEAGKYEAQLILSFKDKVNVSNIFNYQVNKGIEGGI